MVKKTKGPTAKFKVFDKVRWHYPEGKDCPSLKAGKRHIEFMFRLLDQMDMLSNEGRESLAHPLTEDSSLTSEDVTPEGRALLAKHYDKWLESISYKGSLHEDYWDDKIKTFGAASKPKKPSAKAGAASEKKSKTVAKPPQDETYLYDRIDFHWPVNKREGCKTIDYAKSHFTTLMEWLKNNGLLSEKGLTGFRKGTVPDDFELRDDLLTEKGAKLLGAHYDDWFGDLNYGPGPHDTMRLDKALAKLK
jgi:hypothetical protein